MRSPRRCTSAALVDVRPAGEVKDLGEYSGVVLGGGIYMGRWHRDARGFIRRFQDDLRDLPVAVFALGPVDDDPDHRAGSEQQLRAALAKLPFDPVATELFGGAIDPRKLSFPFNHMPAADVRDWDAVRAWAAELVDRFEAARPLALV
jgi:menaquinone-dependent protoporphyrinogen oxidase